MSNTLIFILIALIPILGWVWFFQKQNREKRRYVVLTFIAGMLAVLPIKLYEKYWDVAVFRFEHINLFQYLANLVDVPSLSKLLSFVAVSAIVAVGLFLFLAVVMFMLEIFSGDNSLRVFQHKLRKIFESPFLFVSLGAILGIFAYFFSGSLSEKVWFFAMVGVLEEFVKHLVLRFSDEEKIGSISDAISFAIIVALGFAFVENILYLRNFWDLAGQNVQQFTMFFVLRSTISVIAHVCFTAIFGYFYGIAHFSKEIYRIESQENRHPILRKLHQVLHLKGSTLFHEEKMMEGMILAMVTHAIFNSLLEFGKVAWIVPFLLLMFFAVLHFLHLRETHVRLGNLSSSS